MKKVFCVWSLTILMVICVGFSSCGGGEYDDSGKEKSYNVTYEVSVVSPCYVAGVVYRTATENKKANRDETETGINARTFSKSVTVVTGGISGSDKGFAKISGSIVTWQNGVGEVKDPKLSVKILVNNQLRAETSVYKRVQDGMSGTFELSYTMTDEDKPNKK